jgi:hypothetical protein
MKHWWALARRMPVPLAAAGVSWALVLLLAHSIWGSFRGERLDLQGQQKSLQATLSILEEKRRDETDIRRLTPEAQALIHLGVWGPANRAAWVQTLQQLQSRIPMGETLGYSLGPPRPAGAAGDSVGFALDSGVSSTQVQASWHDLALFGSSPDEEQLWRFARSAERSMAGRFRVESCEFKHEGALPLSFQCQWRFVTLAQPDGDPGRPEAAASLPAALVSPALRLAETRPLGTLLFSPQERARMLQTRMGNSGEGVAAPVPSSMRTISGLIAREGKPPLVWESGGDRNPRAAVGFSGPHTNVSECGRWRWHGQRVDAGDRLHTFNKTIAPSLSASGVQRGSSPPAKCQPPP